MNIILPTKENRAQSGINSRYLNPGDFYFGESNCQIHTILGSCIAITLWHPGFRIGGMCHFVLPLRGVARDAKCKHLHLNGRYSDEAMTMFERKAKQHGTNLNEFQGKIFGGSNMLAKSTLAEDNLIGTKNTEAALAHLSKRSIPLLVAHVGETGYRRIAFDIETGDVWVKHSPLTNVIS